MMTMSVKKMIAKEEALFEFLASDDRQLS